MVKSEAGCLVRGRISLARVPGAFRLKELSENQGKPWAMGRLSAQEAGRISAVPCHGPALRGHRGLPGSGFDRLRISAGRLHGEALSAIGGQGRVSAHPAKGSIGDEYGAAFHH